MHLCDWVLVPTFLRVTLRPLKEGLLKRLGLHWRSAVHYQPTGRFTLRRPTYSDNACPRHHLGLRGRDERWNRRHDFKRGVPFTGSSPFARPLHFFGLEAGRGYRVRLQTSAWRNLTSATGFGATARDWNQRRLREPSSWRHRFRVAVAGAGSRPLMVDHQRQPPRVSTRHGHDAAGERWGRH